MKEIKKITIKQFCEEYNSRVKQLQETYLRENLVITPYVPFLTKNTLAEKLVNVSTYQFEDYTKEDGTIGRRKTNTIRVNSATQYLLFCRVIIENYTNLIVETEGFYEEYDMLKSCGLLDKLMVSTETTPSIIPMDEISEFRSILSMKQADEMTNYTTPQNYIANQVDRFGQLLGVTFEPIFNKIAVTLDTMDEKDIEKFGNRIEKFIKRIK